MGVDTNTQNVAPNVEARVHPARASNFIRKGQNGGPSTRGGKNAWEKITATSNEPTKIVDTVAKKANEKMLPKEAAFAQKTDQLLPTAHPVLFKVPNVPRQPDDSTKRTTTALPQRASSNVNVLNRFLDMNAQAPYQYLQPYIDQFPPRKPVELLPAAFQGERTVIQDSGLDIEHSQYMGFFRRVLSVRRVVQQTPRRKNPSMSVLVLLGNGNGLAGYGQASSATVGGAVKQASQRALKHMHLFAMFENRTIHHTIIRKFKASTVTLRPRIQGKEEEKRKNRNIQHQHTHFYILSYPGFGFVPNPYIHETCRAIGIQDISGKITGSRNPINAFKATFEALQHHLTPQDVARQRGRRVVRL